MTRHYARTTLATERVLTATFDAPVSLKLENVIADYPGAAAIVLRYRLDDPVRGHLPDTVIVKQSMSKDNQIFREWSSLEFLNSRHDVRHLVPDLYGGDQDNEVLVLEDLGKDGELLGNIVEGTDPEAAEAGLLAFQRVLGHLHANTVRQEDTFKRFPVRGDTAAVSRHVVNRIDATLASLPDLLDSEGIKTTCHLMAELDAIRREIAIPGPFLTFNHGDAAVGNVFVGPEDRVWLIDFESSAYRHALLDGSYSRMRYLLSVWARRMPLDLQRRLVNAYREALINGCPEASDDRLFNRALIACSAFWLAAILAYLPSVAEQDRKRGRSTERQRIVTALDHFVRLADDCGMSGALATAADDLHRRLRGRWSPEDRTMRLCKALQ